MTDPWDVGSGSKELNGTYDMMGNVSEWMESSDPASSYIAGSQRVMRGGHAHGLSTYLRASTHSFITPGYENDIIGFRVASVPEPGSITLLVCGAVDLLAYGRRRRERT